VLGFGVTAQTGPTACFDLRVNEYIAVHDRTTGLTALAKAATQTATPETVGLALMMGRPLVLEPARRRLDAVKVFCMFAGPWPWPRPARSSSPSTSRRARHDSHQHPRLRQLHACRR
jgi:hypothetical protein